MTKRQLCVLLALAIWCIVAIWRANGALLAGALLLGVWAARAAFFRPEPVPPLTADTLVYDVDEDVFSDYEATHPLVNPTRYGDMMTQDRHAVAWNAEHKAYVVEYPI